MSPPTAALEKHHSQEADELDFLCRKLSDVRVKTKGIEEELRLTDLSLEQFNQMVNDIHANDYNVLRSTIIKFRKLLAHDDIQPYLDKIIDSLIIPQFVKFLVDFSVPEFQFEAAWILTNIAAGNSQHTAHVVECGAIPALVKLLQESKYKEIREQCVWCLGNIAGDGLELRRAVLDGNALQPLLNLIEQEMNEFLASDAYFAEIPTSFNQGSPSKNHNYNISTLRIALWALSNFCRGCGNSQVDSRLIDIALPVLSQVISCCAPGTPHDDDEVLMDTSWAMSRTLRGINDASQQVYVKKDVCTKLGLLILHRNPEVQIPALRCLINIVSGCDEQTQEVVDAGVLPYLHDLLKSPSNETIRKEACLIISNITAGSVEQVQACINEGLIPTLVDILWNSDFKTKREACWAIGNALLNKDDLQVDWLIQDGKVLPPLLSLIIPGECCDERVVLKTLEACKNVLTVGDEILEKKSKDAVFMEEAVLTRLNGMSLEKKPTFKETDSSYSSMAELYAGKNPYITLFFESVTTPHKGLKSKSSWSGLTILQAYSSEPTQNFGRNAVSTEVKRISSEIVQGWFP